MVTKSNKYSKKQIWNKSRLIIRSQEFGSQGRKLQVGVTLSGVPFSPFKKCSINGTSSFLVGVALSQAKPESPRRMHS